jgi:signal transduction histidine kinase
MELIIKHVRQIFYTLSPPSLYKMSLPVVLAGFCSTFEETNGVHVDLSCQEGLPALPEKHVNAIYRFVQEGLTNVSKHARASSVWINLEYIEGDLTLSMEDNGQGFDLERSQEGIGLRGIRQRFLVLDGSIEIESAPGRGTRLSGTIPFKAGNQ